MKLFVAMPVFASVDPATVQSLMGLAAACPVEFVFRMNIGDAIVSRSRNYLACEFLKTDCTDMLFIDADIAFQPSDVARIASHEQDLVAGMCCKKLPGPPQWTVSAFDKPIQVEPGAGLVELKWLGTGFLRTSRRVLERIGPDCADYLHNTTDEPQKDYFAPMILDGRFIGEDFSFSERWRRTGGKCYVDTDIRLRHVGPISFPIQTN